MSFLLIKYFHIYFVLKKHITIPRVLKVHLEVRYESVLDFLLDMKPMYYNMESFDLEGAFFMGTSRSPNALVYFEN